ncbi:MAG: tetratricopeptide repeat protein [bacterium]|nr:tetratricopeptide repeat protein [bacterium]
MNENKTTIFSLNADWLTEGWRPYLWIALLGLAVYFKAIFFGFAYFDDDHLILQNFVNISSWHNIFTAFKTDMNWQSPGVYYRPLVTLTFMADALWTGKNPMGYHLTNIFFHLLASGLFFRLLLLLGYPRKPSLFFGLLFVCHPVLTHAVAFIPGRYDTALAIMVLGAVTAFLKYLHKPLWLWLGLHALLFAGALFTKETAVIVPVVCALDFALLSAGRPDYKRLLAPAVVWSIGLAVFMVLRGQVAKNVYPQFNTTYENLIGFFSYLGKIIFPVNLSVMPIPADSGPAWGIAVLAILSLLALLGGIGRKRYFLFGAVWFLMFLAPTVARTLSFAYLLEQRLYLPLMGFMMMFMEFIPIQKLSGKKWSWIPAALVLLIFSGITLEHSAVYRNDIAYWENAVKNSPGSYFAHSILGQRYYAQGHPELAEREFQKSLALRPGDPLLENDLGLVLMEQNKLAEAEKAFISALSKAPEDPGIRNNLGMTYIKLGDWAKAESQLRTALALRSNDPEIWDRLALVCYLQKKYVESAGFYYQSIKAGKKPDPRIMQMLAPYIKKEVR